jgi:hypothetical protein
LIFEAKVEVDEMGLPANEPILPDPPLIEVPLKPVDIDVPALTDVGIFPFYLPANLVGS